MEARRSGGKPLWPCVAVDTSGASRPVELNLLPSRSLSVVSGLHGAVWDVQHFNSAYFCEAGGSVCITAGAEWLERRCYKRKWGTRTRWRDTTKALSDWTPDVHHGNSIFTQAPVLPFHTSLHYSRVTVTCESAGVSHQLVLTTVSPSSECCSNQRRTSRFWWFHAGGSLSANSACAAE